MQDRISPLDTFRYLTVTFALISHSMLNHGVEYVVSEEAWLWIRTFTRSATPALAFLFGVMAEVVYFRRLSQAGPGRVFPRLYHRALQCYGAFIGLSALGFAVGRRGLAFFVGSLGFLAPATFANIFSLYFFWLLALVPVLLVRRRWGLPGLLGVIAAVWLVGTAVDFVHTVPRGFSHFSGLVLGIGNLWGPSALHGLTLICAGMAVGNLLYVRRDRSRHVVPVVAVLIGLAALLVGKELWSVGWQGFQHGIVEYSVYRATNSPVYYAYGLVASLLLVGVSYALDWLLPAWMLRIPNRLGGRTFSYFLIGNAVLIAVTGVQVASLAGAVLLLAAYLVLFGGLTLAWGRYREALRIGPLLREQTLVWTEAVAGRLHRWPPDPPPSR